MSGWSGGPVDRWTGRTALGLVLTLATHTHAQQVDRATRPTAPPAAPFKFPAIRTHTLANGLRLLVVEDHSVPVVAVRAIVGADSTWDPAGKEGLFAVTLGALREGSTSRERRRSRACRGDDRDRGGAHGIHHRLSGLRARARPDGRNADATGASTPRESSDENRRKPRRRVESPKRQSRFRGISSTGWSTAPQTRSSGRSCRRKRRSGRSRAADVVRFYDTFFSPRTTTLAIAGDVSDSAALDAATRAFGSWRPRSEPSVADMVRATDQRPRTRIYVRDVPGAGEQAYLYVGELGPSRIDPDAVATEAFAAVASARLQEMLREKRSFIYSSTTGVTWRRARGEGAFVGSTTVSAQKVDSALTEWLRILRELRTTRPPTAGELDAVRRSRVGALPARIDGPDSIVTRLAGDGARRPAARLSSSAMPPRCRPSLWPILPRRPLASRTSTIS